MGRKGKLPVYCLKKLGQNEVFIVEKVCSKKEINR